jgi:hypothetical protein
MKHKPVPDDLYMKPSRGFRRLPSNKRHKDKKWEEKRKHLEEEDCG